MISKFLGGLIIGMLFCGIELWAIYGEGYTVLEALIWTGIGFGIIGVAILAIWLITKD